MVKERTWITIRFESCFLLALTTLIGLLLLTLFYDFVPVKDNHRAQALNNVSLADFNFASVGDWGCSPDAKNTVKNIIDKDPELILGLGDYAYSDNANCWLQIIKPIDKKMKIVIGNHDHLFYTNENESTPQSSQALLQQYMDHFKLTKQYYSFNYQNIHFLAMSTEVPFEVGSPQYNFVSRDLKKTVSDPNITWIVVFYHRAAYTSQVFPGPASNLEIRNIYHPLFQKYGVDLVIQAHVHAYERSYPIEYNATDSFKPIITDNDTKDYHDPTGTIFTIVGTGGSSALHNLEGHRPYVATQLNAFGFLNMKVINNGTVIVGQFYDNNGTVRDNFTITKSENNHGENENNSISPSYLGPRLMAGYEDRFKIESVFQGFKLPTDMTFLGPKDILVLEKNSGTVHRVVDGHMLEKPLLDVTVADKNERGLLGVITSKGNDGTRYVFLYYTETKKEGSDKCPKANYCLPGNEPIGNRLYKYELTENGTALINPKLLLSLPATPGPGHNGGKMIFGSDKKIFLVIGDLMGHKTKSENYGEGKEADGTGGILTINPDENMSHDGTLGSKYPLNLYYAYGIRNSFGLDFDTVTGNLWDTENGPAFGDEINLVKPGFNSGWKDVQGIWNYDDGKQGNGTLDLSGLEDFGGKGNYSAPEFTWKYTVGPTALKFFNSDKMGVEYRDTLFVGDIHDGNLYHFDLNDNRTALLLNGSLADHVADTPEELKQITFAGGLAGISDLEIGPDGYLYILSLGNGEIYRIVPK